MLLDPSVFMISAVIATRSVVTIVGMNPRSGNSKSHFIALVPGYRGLCNAFDEVDDCLGLHCHLVLEDGFELGVRLLPKNFMKLTM